MSYTLVPTELIVDGAITSAKLDTNIAISGTLGVTGEVTLATHLVMGDNDKIKIGTGGDLEIYHDGSNSYISNSTGNIYLGDTNGSVHIQAKLNEESIICAADGAVTLYHDNAVKLATSSAGVTVTGTLTATTLAGTLSTAAQPNITSVGTLTSFRSTGIDDNADALAITIDSSERVGIGTTTPTTALTIRKAIASAAYGQQASMIEFKSYFAGYDTETVKSAIYSGVSDKGTLNTEGGYMAFHVNNNGTMGEKLRIEKSGNVGIGTGSPTRLLTLSGTASPYIALASNTTGGSPAIFFGDSEDDNEGRITYSNSQDYMSFSTATAERMRIDSSGNVGIGTSSNISSPLTVQTDGSANSMSIIGRNNGASDEAVISFYENDGTTRNAYIIKEAGNLGFASGTGGSATERMRIDSGGCVKIHVKNNAYNFQAYASSSNSFFGVYDDANDSANIQIDRSDTATVFYVLGHTGNYHFAGSDVSDKDLKENIKDVPNGSLELVKQLKPRTYNFKSSEGFDDSSRTGFIAQEVADVMTTDHRVASGTDGDKDMGIDPVGLIAHLTKAIQEQQTVIEDLKSRIETLEG